MGLPLHHALHSGPHKPEDFPHQHGGTLSGAGWGAIITALLLAALLLVALLPRTAHARWNERAAGNVQANWELIRQAAWVSGMEDQAPLLAALVAHETDLLPVRGRYNEAVYGPGQVSWAVWGPMLRAKGVAQCPEDLLIDTYAGLLATAMVLEKLRHDYPDRSLDQVLCLYGVGPAALSFNTCQYSRDVIGNIVQVHRVLWSAPEPVLAAR